jgi:PBP4 family serine-type D-alanyl-D-alanine carboxypeptidase
MRSTAPPDPFAPPRTLRRRPLATAILAAAALVPAFEAAWAQAPALERRIAEILARPEFAGSTFGIQVVHLKSGEVVYSHNPAALLPPASAAKLVSCAGALALLGKDYRFETNVVRTGPLENGLVEGDLVLVASGDPNLSQRLDPGGRLRFVDQDHSYAGFADAALVPGDPLVVLRSLAKECAAAGVREVRGDLVVDDGLFRESSDSFVGTFSAVCVNDNLVDITISPGAAGEPATIEFQPRLAAIEVTSLARTGPPGSEIDLWVELRSDPANSTAAFEVRGSIAADARPVLRVAWLPNPALTAAHYFAEALAGEGIKVRGEKRQARFGPTIYRKFPVVAQHRSVPLSEAVRVILKVSHNLHATMLPPLVGAVLDGRGDRQAGYARIQSLLAAAGVPVETIVLQSGSGGGTADRLSASFLASLLKYMATREDFHEFYDALPIGGVDGTLAARFQGSELRGRVRAKTGTLVYRGALNDCWIYLSKSLAGYLDLRTAERPEEILAFSITIANTLAPSRREGADRLFQVQEDILSSVAQSLGFRQEAAGSPEAAGGGR